MAITKKYKAFLITSAILVILFVISVKIYWRQLEKNFKTSSAVVKNCHWGGRGTAAYVVDYSFSINGEEHKSTKPATNTPGVSGYFKIDPFKF